MFEMICSLPRLQFPVTAFFVAWRSFDALCSVFQVRQPDLLGRGRFYRLLHGEVGSDRFPGRAVIPCGELVALPRRRFP